MTERTCFAPLPSASRHLASVGVSPTGYLSALAQPDALVDWRLAVTWEALRSQGVIGALPATVDHLTEVAGVDASAVNALLWLLSGRGLVERDHDQVWHLGSVALRPEEAEALANHGAWVRRWALGITPRLANAAGSLAPGGTLAVITYMRDRNITGAIFGVQMLTSTLGGDAYESAHYRSWLGELGLTRQEVQDMPGSRLTAVAARSA